MTTRSYSNSVNLLLIPLSATLATLLPLHLLLFSYVVLGPLHYLTEISWLADRKFFSKRRFDWLWLTLPTLPVVFLHFLPGSRFNGLIQITLFATIFLGAVFAFSSSVKTRLATLLASVTIGYCLWLFDSQSGLAVTAASPSLEAVSATPSLGWFSPVVALIPTFIHVYVFTGVFILLGVKRAPSLSGVFSATLYLLTPWVLLYEVSTSKEYGVSKFIAEATFPFVSLLTPFASSLGLALNEDGVLALGRVLAFAYTYHYLNWFSKTEVIKWHLIPKTRWYVIGLLYVASLSLYAINYKVGFGVLLGLSLAHVVLEFPLNARSVRELMTSR